MADEGPQGPPAFVEQQRHVFNHIFLSFLRDVQDKSKARDPSVRKTLKPNYKMFDRRSDEHINLLRAQVDESVFDVLADDDVDILQHPRVLQLEIFRDVRVEAIVSKLLHDGDDNDALTVKSYVFLLLTILRFDQSTTNDHLTDRERELLLSKILSIWNNAEVDLDEVLDDTLLRILSRVRALRKQMAENTSLKSCPSMFDGEGLEFLKNSKIGALADEIARDVDMSTLSGMNPEDILSGTADMNSLGSIFASVGKTIQGKIQSGELNQDELLQEAIGFAGNLNSSGHGDIMGRMMQMMSEGGMGDLQQMAENMQPDPPAEGGARERLRHRIREKQAERGA